MSRHTGIALLPLHGGKAPPWLFSRMVLLSREIIIYLVSELGARELGMSTAINRSAIDRSEKVRAFQRLAGMGRPGHE